MRIMAFDYGTKRVGIAVSDDLQIIATSLTTIHPNDIWTFIASYLTKEQVETFVVGKRVKLDGSPSESWQHIRGFIRKLKTSVPGISVVEVDERFTSKIATRVIAESGLKKNKKQDKKLVDTVSANLILQTYMESKG